MAAAFGILPLAALVHPCTAEGRATQEQLPGEILYPADFIYYRSNRFLANARNDKLFQRFLSISFPSIYLRSIYETEYETE